MIETRKGKPLYDRLVLSGLARILQPSVTSVTVAHNLGYTPKAIVANGSSQSGFFSPLPIYFFDYTPDNGFITSQWTFYVNDTVLIIDMNTKSGFSWAPAANPLGYPFVYYLFDSRLDI